MPVVYSGAFGKKSRRLQLCISAPFDWENQTDQRCPRPRWWRDEQGKDKLMLKISPCGSHRLQRWPSLSALL